MTAGVRLFEIADEYRDIIDALVEAGGEITPELQEKLEAVTDDFKKKVERVALYVRNLLAMASVATAEAARLSAIASSHEKSATSLKQYLLDQMIRLDMEKVESPLIRVRIQKNPISVRWPGEIKDIPEPYRRITVSLDGQLAREHQKQGLLPESFVVEQGKHVRIY